MPKYKDSTPFIQLNREIFHKDCVLSWKAKWLFTVLCELEHRYTGKKENFFFRDQKTLSEDTGMTLRAIRECRKELVSCGLLEHWQMHWIDKNTGKKSEKHVTAYRLLR